jgi:hypothetical protein
MPEHDPQGQWGDRPQDESPRWEQPRWEQPHWEQPRWDQIGSAEPPGRRRRGWVAAASLVGGGLLAGAVLAGTLSAGAATGGAGGGPALAVPAAVTSTTTGLPQGSDGDGSGPWGWRHGSGGGSVPTATADQVQRAVTAKYPGATVWWVRSDSSGGYVAYTGTTDGKALAVHVDGSYAVTGADSLPAGGNGTCGGGARASVPADTAATVQHAVLAKYPGATVWWVRSDSSGYVAYTGTTDGKALAVHVDGSYAVTGADTLPGPGSADGWGHWGQPVPDAAAGHVKDAVLARYPGASVPWMWSDPDGGYVAYAVQADGTRVVVQLDSSYAITGTRTVPSC